MATNRYRDPPIPRTVQPVNPAPTPPAGGPFQALGSTIPASYFFNDRIANSIPAGSGYGPVRTGPGTPQGSVFSALSGATGRPSVSDIARNSLFAGLTDSSTINAVVDAARGNGTWTNAGLTALGNVGDGFVGSYIDRQTGQPISTYANMANLIAQGVAPGSAFANLTNAIAHPVSTGINYVTGSGAQAASTAGTQAAGSAAGTTTTTSAADAGGQGPGGALGAAMATYGLYQGVKGARAAYEAQDVENGMVSGATAGAAVGSYVGGPVGTVAGGVIGGALGALYVGSGNPSSDVGTQKNAWSQFARAGADTDFRGSAFPLDAALDGAMRSDNDRDRTFLSVIGDNRQSGYPTSLYAFSWIKNQIRQAQADGRLPTDPAQLSQISGQGFFDKELAPAIWGDKPGGNDKLRRLLGAITDDMFYTNSAAQNTGPTSDDYVHQQSDGSFFYDEAALRNRR